MRRALSDARLLRAASPQCFVLVFEDDFEWRFGVEDTRLMLRESLGLTDWNVTLLGSQCGHGRPWGKFTRVAHECRGASAYAIRLSFIPRLLQLWETQDNFLDIAWWALQTQENGWLQMQPTLGFQQEGHSDIEQTVVNYNVKMFGR